MKYISYILVLVVLFGCNSDKDKKMFESAEKKYNEKNYKEALIEFENVANEYSSSQFAAKSLMKLGSMYQMYLVPQVDQNKSNQKAVDYYRRLYKDFSDYSETPKALFMAGYILANNLNKLEEAKLVYQEFIKEYPNDKLAAQAKMELNNLGKTPEEILQNNIKSK